MPLRRVLPPILVVAVFAALFASRAGLVLHEFLGHAGAARALGGTITGYHLFYFGGGRVHYAFAEPLSTAGVLVVALAGIAVELVIGAATLVLARRLARPVVRFVAAVLGGSLVIHGLYYLVEGTHYGYGDARAVHLLLGAARLWFVAGGACVLAALAFVAGNALARFVQGWLGAHRLRERAIVVAAVVVVAGGGHLGLTKLEAALTPDETYARIFRDEATVEADRAFALELRARAARGEPLSESEQQRLLAELRARSRPFPLRPLLVGLLGASALAGLFRRREPAPAAAPGPLDWRDARAAALAAGAAMAIVVLLHDA